MNWKKFVMIGRGCYLGAQKITQPADQPILTKGCRTWQGMYLDLNTLGFRPVNRRKHSWYCSNMQCSFIVNPYIWSTTHNSPVHLNFDLESLDLIKHLYFFFSFLKKITSGGLIMYLGEFDFSTNIYLVKIIST